MPDEMIKAAPRFMFDDVEANSVQVAKTRSFISSKVFIKNISSTGICFVQNHEDLEEMPDFHLGEVIYLEMSPLGVNPMACTATIIRRNEVDGRVEYGAQFKNIPLLYKERLTQSIMSALFNKGRIVFEKKDKIKSTKVFRDLRIRVVWVTTLVLLTTCIVFLLNVASAKMAEQKQLSNYFQIEK